jgi:AI-2 transport protein TqsA
VKKDANFSKVTVVMLTIAAFVIIIAGMRAAAGIINPFLLSVFLAILFSPPLFWMQRNGVPNAVAIAVIILILLAVLSLMGVIVERSVNSFSRELPAYQQRLTVITGAVFDWLGQLGLKVSPTPLTDYFSPGKAMRMAANLLSGLTGLFTNLFFIFLTSIFILLAAAGFPRKVQAAFKDPEKTVGHFRAFFRSVNRYLVIKTIFSLATGLCIWIWLAVLGVDFAPTWGMVAFFFNFVPNIGSIIAAIPAILLALIQLGWPSALLACLGYLVVNIVFGNILEPRYMGLGLGLSTLVVFISLIFWGWVLGTIGMVLSVPLTMILKIALASNEDTQWIAIMLE